MSDTYATRSDLGAMEGRHVHRRVSWSALFGGVVIVLATQLLLSLLGAGIGFGNVNLAASSTPSASSFGIGAGIWWVASSCIALFVGGFASAWLAGNKNRFDGMLHGLVTWGLATLLTMYLLTTAVGGLIGGGFSAISSITSSAGAGIKDAAAPVANAVGVSPDMIKQQVDSYLQPTNPDPATMSPQDAQKEFASDLVTYEKGGPDAPAAKARMISIMSVQMKISPAEATKKFDDAQAKLDQTIAATKQKAKAAADDAASAASRTMFALFVDLLLGAIAAGIGGAIALGSSAARINTTRARVA